MNADYPGSSAHPLPRREFLKKAGAAASLAALGGIPAVAQTTNTNAPTNHVQRISVPDNMPHIRVFMHDAGFVSAVPRRRGSLHARDLANDPLPVLISSANGRARIALAEEPIQLSMLLEVPGFGEIVCYADNDGKGYTHPGEYDFVVEAAKTRLRRVREYAVVASATGVPSDPEFEKHLAEASKPLPPASGPPQVAAAYESLAHGLYAGEKIVLNAARHRIAKLAAPRKDFYFGCSASGWRNPDFAKRFLDLFNFATISWYIWGKEEPVEARIEYSRMDQCLDWCLANGLRTKGFGYTYLVTGATPEWLRVWPYEKILAEYKRVETQTLHRYDGRIQYVEVINEVHDKSNLFHYDHQQILELTRETCQAAGEGSKKVKRLINNCCLWAEYAKHRNDDGTRRWSPYQYLADSLKAGAKFETIGLQLYYPEQDLFEIERMLDRFKDFKKPIHISEISCQSADGLDPNSMRPKSFVPGWHGPWTETMQADWVEAIYTLCYSKPEFEQVGWWDFSDSPGHFWPFGGLLHADYTPKESYLRLQELKRKWQIGKTA